MRVAIVMETFLPKLDGIVRMLTELLAYLARRGHEALVVAPGAGPQAYAGFAVARLPRLPRPGALRPRGGRRPLRPAPTRPGVARARPRRGRGRGHAARRLRRSALPREEPGGARDARGGPARAAAPDRRRRPRAPGW